MFSKSISPGCFLVLMVFVITVVPLGGVQGADTPVQLPELTFRVTSVQGPASWRADTASAWRSLEPEVELDVGDHVRTGETGTVDLEVPGVSFMTVQENSRVQLTHLDRKTRSEGLLTEETVVVNEITLESKKGTVQNSLRRHRKVRNDYKLETPNAVAGVRGTTFQCEADAFNRTECAVLNGEVRFYAPGRANRGRTLRGGQVSRLAADATRPSEPESLSQNQQEQLSQFKRQAQQSLQLKPTIGATNLNGNEFQNSIRVKYEQRTTLTLAGGAQAPEQDHSLESMMVQLDGENLAVEGTSDWSVELSPLVPDEGSERTLTVEVTARDSEGLVSRTYTRTIILVNPANEDAGSVLPKNYEPGNVPVSVASVAGKPVGRLEFPYHVYTEDLQEGGLTLRGSVETDKTVEGVAYSLDDGRSWHRATGGSSWSAGLSFEQSGERTILLRAWTADGVIGDPVEVGPLHYHAYNQTAALRRLYEDFWTAFEEEDSSRLRNLLSESFLQNENGEERDRSEFDQFLQNLWDRFQNLRVDYTINNNIASPTGGEILGDIEWEGQIHQDDSQGKSVTNPFVMRDEGTFKITRNEHGLYKILTFEQFSMEIIRYTEREMTLYFRDGIDIVGLEKMDNQSLNACGDAHRGQIIAAINGQHCCYFGRPAELNVNPGPNATPPALEWTTREGGITQLSATSFSEVDVIPSLQSGQYEPQELTFGTNTDGIFAFMLQREINGDWVTGLIEVVDSEKIDADTYGSVTVRIISALPDDDAPFRDYGGVNPFD